MRNRLFQIGILLGTFGLLACEPGEEVGGTPPDEPPPTAKIENAIISSSLDELFPVAEGQHVVCMRLNAKSEDGGNNCTACPQCNGCFWDIVHADLATNEVKVLETVERLQSTPRLADGRAYWTIYENNKRRVIIWNLLTGKRAKFTAGQNWYGNMPLLKGDYLYWRGYNQQIQSHGISRTQIYSGVSKFLFSGSFMGTQFATNNSMTQMARSLPVVVTDEAVYWVTSQGPGRSIQKWRFSDSKQSKIYQNDEGEIFALTAGLGFIAWKETQQYGSCWNQSECKVSIKARIDGESEEIDLTPADGEVSRYGRLSVSLDKVFWADFRFGPYALFGRDIYNPQDVELRYTSSDAIVGTTSDPVVSDTHLIWMDRRDSNWDIYSRPF